MYVCVCACKYTRELARAKERERGREKTYKTFSKSVLNESFCLKGDYFQLAFVVVVVVKVIVCYAIRRRTCKCMCVYKFAKELFH